MALSREFLTVETQLSETGTELGNINSSIAALPATPVEADLPDIVAIVASLSETATTLNTLVKDITNLVRTTRINQ